MYTAQSLPTIIPANTAAEPAAALPIGGSFKCRAAGLGGWEGGEGIGRGGAAKRMEGVERRGIITTAAAAAAAHATCARLNSDRGHKEKLEGQAVRGA